MDKAAGNAGFSNSEELDLSRATGCKYHFEVLRVAGKNMDSHDPITGLRRGWEHRLEALEYRFSEIIA